MLRESGVRYGFGVRVKKTDKMLCIFRKKEFRMSRWGQWRRHLLGVLMQHDNREPTTRHSIISTSPSPPLSPSPPSRHSTTVGQLVIISEAILRSHNRNLNIAFCQQESST
jgi:hypothetical protein